MDGWVENRNDGVGWMDRAHTRHGPSILQRRERRGLPRLHVEAPEVHRGAHRSQRGLEQVGLAHGDAARGDEHVAAVGGGWCGFVCMCVCVWKRGGGLWVLGCVLLICGCGYVYVCV